MMRSLLTLGASALLVAMPAASAPGDPATTAPARLVLATPADGGPGFSIAIPAGLAPGGNHGIDSLVTSFEGEGIALLFDYGWYSAILPCDGAGCVSRRETIGGREAQVVEAEWPYPDERPYRLYVGALFELDGPVRLSARALCTDPPACARAMAILRTIEFATRPPAMPAVAPAGEGSSACRAIPPPATAFPWLEPLLEANGERLFGRRRAMTCFRTAAGAGECRVRAPSELRFARVGGEAGFLVGAGAIGAFGGGAPPSCRAQP